MVSKTAKKKAQDKAPKQKAAKKRPPKKVRTRRAAKGRRDGPADAVIEVKLGTLSVGKTTAGLGFKIDKGKIGLQEVFDLLVGARLDVEISTAPGQQPLFDGAIPSLDSVADVHKLSIGLEDYSGKLTFRRDDTDLESLSELVSQPAEITFRRIGSAGEEGKNEEGEDSDRADATPEEAKAEPKTADPSDPSSW